MAAGCNPSRNQAARPISNFMDMLHNPDVKWSWQSSSFLYDFYLFIFKQVLHLTGGLSSQPWSQESHVLSIEPARRSLNWQSITGIWKQRNLEILNFQDSISYLFSPPFSRQPRSTWNLNIETQHCPQNMLWSYWPSMPGKWVQTKATTSTWVKGLELWWNSS